ncbi:hypothetical protein GF327_10330 [Candidatus Woesearchaeota archaeon]|nr:hypothetical protein [Candidatus Woesearchaeota archaeon]
MKLLLAYPEIECSVTRTSTYSVPLGLGSIGTYCKQKLGDSLDVKILDGSMMSHEEQLRETGQYNPDVIGINSTIGSQANAYEIAKLAKEKGSLVLFGGVHSTNLWQNMLQNRDFIDGVILYEGEIPSYFVLNRMGERQILGNGVFQGIPNLAYRDSFGEIVSPQRIFIPHLDDLPDVDYSLFDMQRFLEQTRSRGFGKAVSYYAGKGCAKRGNVRLKTSYGFDEYNQLVNAMDVCSFCGRNELGLRNFEEDREARIVKELHEKYGITGFFNVQDTVNLRNTSPIGVDGWYRLFIGTESITPQNIKRLQQRYGNNLIFQAGIEAANPQMRAVYGKRRTNLDDLVSKVEIMRDEGIQLHASFILGGRGETKDFMQRTTETARQLAEYDNVTWILMSPQLILPGSPDYRALMQMPQMNRKYANEDLIDIVGINQDFLRLFTPDLTREEIVEEIKRTFDEIRGKDRKPILDVKGVVEKEEKYIQPNRPYSVGSPNS